MKQFMNILRDENGQGMVEYGLILGLIAIVAIGVIALLGGDVKNVFTSAQEKLSSAASGEAPAE